MKNNMVFLVSGALALLVNTMHGMHTVKRIMRPVRKSKMVKRTHYSVYKEPAHCMPHEVCITELRESIAKPWPDFNVSEALGIIEKSIPRIEPDDVLNTNHCAMNSTIKSVVNRAAMNRKQVDDYAQLISVLGERGWYVHYDCCEATALHNAALYNLLPVAKALIQYSGDNLLKDDKLGRVPHHYIQSREMAELILFNYGVGGFINAQDHNGDTPLHLAAGEAVDLMVSCGADPRIENKVSFFKHTYQTPLRKRMADGDVHGCKSFFYTHRPVSFVNESEYHLLKKYIAMRLYETAGELHRFDNKRYLQIACMLEESQKG